MASAWGSSWGAYWGNSWGSISVSTGPTPAGRKRKSRKRKVFVELDGEILLFNTASEAYSYLKTSEKEAPVVSALTGKKLKKPAKVVVEVEPDVISVPQITAYVEDQRLPYDVDLLIRQLNFMRLLEIQEQMDEELIILLMGS